MSCCRVSFFVQAWGLLWKVRVQGPGLRVSCGLLYLEGTGLGRSGVPIASLCGWKTQQFARLKP